MKRWSEDELRERLHLGFLAYYQASELDFKLDIPIETVAEAFAYFIAFLGEQG